MSKIIQDCIGCSTSFTSYISQNRKFCTRECQSTFLKTLEGQKYKSEKILEGKRKKNITNITTKECKYCGREYKCPKSTLKNFCTVKCRYNHLSNNKEKMKMKQQETNIQRYGERYHMKNQGLIDKMKNTVTEKYGSIINHPRYSEKSRLKSVETCLKKYGKSFAPSFIKESKAEKEIVDFIKEIGPNLIIEENNRTLLKGKEVDIYIPEKQIAIEYNGLFYHSESKIPDRYYHLNKTKSLAEQNIKLIHIFSDEWELKKDIVKKKLFSILNISNGEKIYARNCTVSEIDKRACIDFLNKNHIQGADKSRIKLGLYYNTELVGVMTFSVGKIAMGQKYKEGLYELSRFATNKNIPGGASKLLSFFVKNYSVSKIYSYADRRWSTGNLYEKIGFIQTKISLPSYWYVDDYRNRYYRYGFRKSVLLSKGLNIDKSEREIMKELGYDRIWDCGTIKYELNI